MIKASLNQKGSAHIVIIIILVVVTLGTLGYVVWNNFLAPKNNQSAENTNTSEVETEPCKDNDGSFEKDGTICSEDLGIKFSTPTIFENKFKQAENYEIFKGTVDYTTRTSAGNSDIVYSAIITGIDEFTLTIAKEPLRSGYVNVGHALQGTYYDMDTGLLSLTNSPTSSYNSATDTSTTSGVYSVGETVPSFMVGDTKFYHGNVGDAGLREETYFAVVNGSFVKIKLSHSAYMGPSENDPSTIDADPVFKELESAIKNIELINK